MPPIALNRRRFLGCSAAASLALSQGTLAEATTRLLSKQHTCGWG